MQCPDCGTLMNRHAEKPLKDARHEEPLHFDPVLGGVIAAIHCCQGCGKVEAELLSIDWRVRQEDSSA